MSGHLMDPKKKLSELEAALNNLLDPLNSIFRIQKKNVRTIFRNLFVRLHLSLDLTFLRASLI